MTDSASIKNDAPDAEQVADYLARHPDFLRQREDLLRAIDVPHQTGADASLIEYRVRVLSRDRQALETRIHRLAENARDNERLADKLLDLCMDLMTREDARAVVEATQASLTEDFAVDAIRFRLSDCPAGLHEQLSEFCTETEPGPVTGEALKTGKATVTPLSRDEKAELFPEAEGIRSTAVIPLTHGRDLGVMALGRSTPDGFDPAMGTHFLDRLGRIVSAALVPFWDTGSR